MHTYTTFYSIIGGNTSRSGSLVAYHPSVDMKGYAREVDLKNYCCKNLSDQVCDRYFERRPNDNGTNYASPAGGKIYACHVMSCFSPMQPLSGEIHIIDYLADKETLFISRVEKDTF